MADDKKLSLSNRGKLGPSGPPDKGQVRQSFSHGRSKPVVVEHKKRRSLNRGPSAEKSDSSIRSFKIKKTEESEPEKNLNLTNEELSTRTEALKDAIRQAEEDRMRAAEEKVRRDEEKRRVDEAESKRKAEDVTDENAQEKIEEAARKKAENEARQKAEEEAQQKVEEEAQLLADAQSKLESVGKEAKTDRKADAPSDSKIREIQKAEKKRVSKKIVRRGEERRRSGKLTVAMALGGGDDTRQRSLAALKRAQAKQRRAMQGADPQAKKSREIIIPEAITVQELANRMAERARDVIKVLASMDVEAGRDDSIDPDTAELVVVELGYTVKRVSEADVEVGLVGEEDDTKDLISRPPIVTIMGHVDHGKTSLLDALRETDVVAGEAGGITQHIGAYQTSLGDDHKITFIDTPGHEAFTEMRARGASVTDIVVLVVAADDGIMPQTIEAINHAREAKVPIIVAINKIDREGADPDRVRQELLQHEVIVEALSGDVLDVEVSALKKTNLDRLKEIIILQSELMELKANPNRNAEGSVIEARLDKSRGPVATILIKRGTLKIGDIFVAGAEWGKIKALADEHGNALKEASPAQPVEILGLNGSPVAGDDFVVVESEARAREVIEYRQAQKLKERQGKGPESLEAMFEALKEAKAKEFPVVVKADVQGSVEAITQALEKIGNEEIQARVIHGAVGGITEADVTLADASSAPIIGFNVRANRQAEEAAKRNGVVMSFYSVIYHLIDDIKGLMAGQLPPAIDETKLGLAEVKDVFSAGKIGKAAGCLIVDGLARSTAKARLLRDDTVVWQGAISSLRRFKDEVKEVKAGTECGVTLENYNNIKPGDQIEIYEETERQRTL